MESLDRHVFARSHAPADYRVQLGHGDREGSCVPRLVETLRKHTVGKVVCGSRHTLALCSTYFVGMSLVLRFAIENGEVYAWGFNKFGQLGAAPAESTSVR